MRFIPVVANQAGNFGNVQMPSVKRDAMRAVEVRQDRDPCRCTAAVLGIWESRYGSSGCRCGEQRTTRTEGQHSWRFSLYKDTYCKPRRQLQRFQRKWRCIPFLDAV